MTALILGLAAFFFWMLAIALYVFAHSWAAAWFHVPTEEISIGFGPSLYQRRFDDWTFRIGLFPGGGYAKFVKDDEIEEDAWLQAGERVDPPMSDERGLVRFKDATPFQRLVIVTAGPLAHLFLGLLLLALPILAGVRQLAATSPDQSIIRPCAVPGLKLLDQPYSWDGQGELMSQTAFEFLRRAVLFESLEGWGGYFGFCVTTGLVGAYSGWAWITCMGVVVLLNGIINLFPIPVLNGGHVVFLLYEAIAGRPLPEWVRLTATYIGLLFISILWIRIMWIDLRWLWNVTFG